MTSNQQPEALRLADMLQLGPEYAGACRSLASIELRRLHGINFDLCRKANTLTIQSARDAEEIARLNARVEKLENALLEIQQVACSNSPELHISTKALA